MRTNLIIFLIVALLIAGGVIWYLLKENKYLEYDVRFKEEQHRRFSEQLLGKVRHRDSATSTRINDLLQDSVLNREENDSLKTQTKLLSRRVNKKVPVVQDTIILIQDRIISNLEQERDTLYVVGGAIVDSLHRSNLELSELFKGQLLESIKLQNQVDREKRRRFSIGPHVGAGLRGADVGVSVQYSLFRF